MNFEDGQRPPRPTIRALRALPDEPSSDAKRKRLDTARKLIAAKKFDEVELYDLEHSLLDDARDRFRSGAPDQHRAASKAAGRPVYEVRSRTGAAWRGAVVRDDQGDPWLVYVDRHDQFHNRVADALHDLDNLLPRSAEYKLRAREEAAIRHREWRRQIVESVLTGLAEVLRTNTPQLVDLPADPRTGDPGQLELALEHDSPRGTDSLARTLETTDSLATLTIRSIGRDSKSFHTVIQEVVPLLQPDREQIDAAYTRSGDLELWFPVAQAKLAQVLAATLAPAGPTGPEGQVSPLTQSHYVDKPTLTSGVVQGHAVRAVCGLWFVPTCEDADLPICERCEKELPVVRKVYELIQAGGSQGH